MESFQCMRIGRALRDHSAQSLHYTTEEVNVQDARERCGKHRGGSQASQHWSIQPVCIHWVPTVCLAQTSTKDGKRRQRTNYISILKLVKTSGMNVWLLYYGNQEASLTLFKNLIQGQPGWLSGLALPLVQSVILEPPDWVPRRPPCMGPASPSACVSASLSRSVSLMNK